MPAPNIPLIPPTTHLLAAADARELPGVAPASVDLVVTSPPYPMIAMWDTAFGALNPGVTRALEDEDGLQAFRLMHAELDRAWAELLRAVRPGGFICLNIGDAVRTVGGRFSLYPNHTRIESFFLEHGADVLPRVLWRKTTNAPNKFMGSGVLPAGAYVTLEHEYILIFRQQGKRDFSSPAERERRQRSAIFWEERNAWYSDLWELAGARQDVSTRGAGELFADDEAPRRPRSGAFPFDVAYRLVSMYSLQGDTVLDPFAGTGTTALAALALARHSLMFDIDPGFISRLARDMAACVPALQRHNRGRLERHHDFVSAHLKAGKAMAHRNEPYGFPVKTVQERGLIVPIPASVKAAGDKKFLAEYEAPPRPA